jgi:hypothetical protein
MSDDLREELAHALCNLHYRRVLTAETALSALLPLITQRIEAERAEGAAEERERCAKVAEEYAATHDYYGAEGAQGAAAAIRSLPPASASQEKEIGDDL